MKSIFAVLLLTIVSATLQAQPKQETLKIFWPTEYKWKIGSNQQTGTQQLVEIVPGNESINNWTIIGSMMVLKGVQKNVATIPAALFAQTQKRSSSAKLMVLEQGITNGYNWVMFKIQSPSFMNSRTPESQLYYVIQGKSALFINFVAVKQAMLSPLFLQKWAVIFKQSRLAIK